MKADAAWESELEEMNRGKRGRPFAYADGLIKTIGTFRLIIDTPYRQCQGAAKDMLGKENTPHFTTLCRRLNRMEIVPGRDPATASVVDGSREIRLAIDGSGLIPSTRGEWIRHVWKVKRGFIRLSILVDVNTKMVLAFAITDESVGESPRLSTLLDEALEKLGMPGRVGTSQVVITLMGDKVYDSRENFSHCRKHRVAAGIPVKVNANCRADGVDRARTGAVLDQLGGGEGATPGRVAALLEEERRANQKDWKRRTSQGAGWARRGRVLIVKENPGRGRPGRKVALYHPGGGQQDQRIQLDVFSDKLGGSRASTHKNDRLDHIGNADAWRHIKPVIPTMRRLRAIIGSKHHYTLVQMPHPTLWARIFKPPRLSENNWMRQISGEAGPGRCSRTDEPARRCLPVRTAWIPAIMSRRGNPPGDAAGTVFRHARAG